MEDVNERIEESSKGKTLGDLMSEMETQASSARETVVNKKLQNDKVLTNTSGMGAQTMSNNDVPKLDGNYHEIKDLPSKGKLYPKGTIIQARPLKVIEVKKLSSINEDNADDIVNDILRRTVIGINVNDILLSDKLYIVFWLRANTYRDSSYKVGFSCDKCESESNYHFELNSLSINYIKDDFDPNVPITLAVSKDELEMRFLTIGEERELYNFMENYKRTIKDIDVELLGLAFMTKSINGEEHDVMSRYKYILNMDPRDYSQVSTYVSDNAFGIDPWINAKCEKCGGESQIGITFREDFFIPKYIV
ncbi:MAG: hypothetical protein ACOC33_01490 [bacterium]